MNVEFRHLPGWPGYAVDSEGNVWSCHRRGPCQYFSSHWTQRKKMLDRHGYYEVTFYCDGKVIRPKVHTLVLLAFVGKCPAGYQACHENGIRTCNRISNLRWDTPANNMADRDRHGSVKRERNGRAKLTETQVAAIRAEYVRNSAEFGQNALAKKYRISQKVICDILHGRLWPI
jgi:hypothetical protein